MRTIEITRAAADGRALVAAARRADADKNGLTTDEIRQASADGVITPRQAGALQREHLNHRISVNNDPEIPSRDKATAARFMDVDEVKFMVTMAVEQLNRIDEYKGTKRPARPANDTDGFITDAEVKNYGPSRGQLQKEAGRLVDFVLGNSAP